VTPKRKLEEKLPTGSGLKISPGLRVFKHGCLVRRASHSYRRPAPLTFHGNHKDKRGSQGALRVTLFE